MRGRSGRRGERSAAGSGKGPAVARWLAFATLLLLLAALAWRTLGDLDHGVHVAVGRWLVSLGACAVALPLNPYHVRAVFYPLLLATRMRADNLFAQHITELVSPFSIRGDPRFPYTISVQLAAYKAFFAGAALSLLGLIKKRRLGEAAVVVTFGALSAAAIRNLVLFAIAGLPAIAEGLAALAPSLAETPRVRLARRVLWRPRLAWRS